MNKFRTAALALSLSLLALPAAEANTTLKTEETGRSTSSTIYSQDAEAVILTMGRALNIALDSNFTVLTAEEGVESAKGAKKAASSALNPYFNLSGEANAYSEVPNTPDNETLAQVGLSQSLYSGGKNQALAKQGAIGVKKAEHELQDTRESVAQTVWNAYCEVLYRREVLRNTTNALEYYTNAEKELVQRVIYGLSTNLDLTRVRQQKEDARASNITAGNNLEVSRIELCRLLRMPPETPIVLSGSLEDGLPTIEEARQLPEDAQAAIERALERRGDYQALLRAAESQKKEITIAKSGMLPTITLSSGYRFSYGEQGYSYATSTNQWTGSLTIDVPLYDGGNTSGNVRTAKASLKAAEHAAAEKRDTILAELADNWLNLQNALETLSAGRVNVQLAEESLSYAETGYREGVNTQLDVLQARSELTDALQLLAQYLRDSREAQASLWKARGVLLENALKQENLRDMGEMPIVQTNGAKKSAGASETRVAQKKTK